MPIPKRRLAFEADPSIDFQQMDSVEAADEQLDCPASTISAGDALVSGPESIEAFDCLTASDLEASPEDNATSADKTCRFDDEDAEYLSPDSELDWENAPFDYDVVFEATRGQLLIPSETSPPDGTPALRGYVVRLARRVANAMAKQTQALRGQALDAYNGGVAGAEQAAQITELVAREVERNGLAVAQEATRVGGGILRMLLQRWPGIMRGMGEDGWLDRVAEAVVRAPALMPMVEQVMAVTRNRRR